MERKRNYPTPANLARRAAESAARSESGGLDPKAENRARLREILAKQRAMGLDRWVGLGPTGTCPGRDRDRVSHFHA